MSKMTEKERSRKNQFVTVYDKKIYLHDVALRTLDSTHVRIFPVNDTTAKIRGYSSGLPITETRFIMNESVAGKLLDIVGRNPEVHKTNEHEITLYKR